MAVSVSTLVAPFTTTFVPPQTPVVSIFTSPSFTVSTASIWSDTPEMCIGFGPDLVIDASTGDLRFR